MWQFYGRRAVPIAGADGSELPSSARENDWLLLFRVETERFEGLRLLSSVLPRLARTAVLATAGGLLLWTPEQAVAGNPSRTAFGYVAAPTWLLLYGDVAVCVFTRRLAAIPIRTFHGDEDDVVMPKRSFEMVEAVRRRGRAQDLSGRRP